MQETSSTPPGDDFEKVKAFVKAYHADEALRARAEADPRAVLVEHGIHPPPGFDLHVVADTPTEIHLVMPPAPNGELSDDYLDTVVGGWTGWGLSPGQFDDWWRAEMTRLGQFFSDLANYEVSVSYRPR